MTTIHSEQNLSSSFRSLNKRLVDERDANHGANVSRNKYVNIDKSKILVIWWRSIIITANITKARFSSLGLFFFAISVIKC